MKAGNFLIFIFTNFFRTYVSVRFFGVFLERKSGKGNHNLRLSAFFACFLLTSAGYLLFQDRNVNIVTNIVGMFLIALTFEGNVKSRLVAVCIIYFFHMICDVMVVFFFGYYDANSDMNEYLGMMTVLFVTICEILAEKIVNRRKRVSFLSPYWPVLLFIPSFSMVMIYFLLYARIEEHVIITIQGSCLLIINIIAFFLYGTMEEAYFANIENHSLLQTYKNYKNQLEIIMDSQEQLRSFQHDMKYHLRDLLSMSQKQNIKEMTAYLEEMTTLISNPNEYVYSGNKEIDSNLNYLLKVANQKLKTVSVKLTIPEFHHMSFVDVNIILSNLLDNAILASERTEEKYLKLDMSVRKTLLYIDVENSYDGILKSEKGRLLTTNQNKELHGYGLKNVNKIVKKYQGALNIHYTESRFSVNIMLYLMTEEQKGYCSLRAQ